MSGNGLSAAVLLVIGCMSVSFVGCDKGTGPIQAPQPIEIIAPKGGESYKAGETVTIKWQINDRTKIAGVGIKLSIDNGKSDSLLVGHSISAETTSVSWAVTSAKVSNQCIIKVYEYNDESIFAKSGAFSVTE